MQSLEAKAVRSLLSNVAEPIITESNRNMHFSLKFAVTPQAHQYQEFWYQGVGGSAIIWAMIPNMKTIAISETCIIYKSIRVLTLKVLFVQAYFTFIFAYHISPLY